MANKHQVLALHKKHPEWSSLRIASELSCSDGYVRATFYREGLTFARKCASRGRRKIDQKKAKRLRDSGISLDGVAMLLGASKEGVRIALLRAART